MGHQLAQSCHGVSQFMLEQPEKAKDWNNGYLIVLSTDRIHELVDKLLDMEIEVSLFREPDMNDELTSLCFLETSETVKLTRKLPLALN